MASAVINVTGTTPQTVAATLTPGNAYRVLGFCLTSTGTGIAIIKAGSNEVTRIALPGGAVLTPSISWELIGRDSGTLTVVADTAGVQIVGNIVYDTVKIPVLSVPDVQNPYSEAQIFRRRPADRGPWVMGPMPSSNGV